MAFLASRMARWEEIEVYIRPLRLDVSILPETLTSGESQQFAGSYLR
jgi:hypothetical protein